MKINNNTKKICKLCNLLPLPLITKIYSFFILLSARRVFDKARAKGRA